MAENYFSAENLSKSFGEQVLFENLTFGLAKGDKTALVARNGTGKTTLLSILMGRMEPDTGEYVFRKGIKTAFLEQTPKLDDSLSVDQLILSSNTEVKTGHGHEIEPQLIGFLFMCAGIGKQYTNF